MVVTTLSRTIFEIGMQICLSLLFWQTIRRINLLGVVVVVVVAVAVWPTIATSPRFASKNIWCKQKLDTPGLICLNKHGLTTSEGYLFTCKPWTTLSCCSCFEKLIIDSTIFVGHTFAQTTLLTSIPWFYDPKKVRDKEKAVIWQTIANRVFEMRGPLCHGHGWFVRQHCGIITQFSSNCDRTLWWFENAELVSAKWLLDISRRRNWIFWMQSWVCSITRVFTASCQHGINVFEKQSVSEANAMICRTWSPCDS